MNWNIEAHEDEEYIRFIAPSGFKFDYKSINDVISTLSSLADRSTEFQFTKHFERFYIDQGGDIRVIQCDPWINEGFSGKFITNCVELSKVLTIYLAERYGNSPGNLSNL